MLKKLDELLMQYELADNYYEKSRILREIQYLNLIVRRSLRNYINSLSHEELLSIAHDYNIEGDVETVKTVLYTRLNCLTNTYVEISSANGRILVTKEIVATAKKHNIEITNDQEFIKILSDLINTINSYNLRLFPEFTRFEALDYATRVFHTIEIPKDMKANYDVANRARNILIAKTHDAGREAAESLLRFFSERMSKFYLDLLALLLKHDALEPDYTKDKGCFIYRIKDFNFYDSYLTAMNQVPITMDDINYGLKLDNGYTNGIQF